MEKDPKEKSQPKSRIIFCGLNENLDSKDSPASLLIKSLTFKNSEVLNKMTGKEEKKIHLLKNSSVLGKAGELNLSQPFETIYS